MRVVIWNAHWHTLGGGEVYAGYLAKFLQDMNYRVVLLGTGSNPTKKIKERLGVDLSGITYREIFSERDVLEELNQDDIFINASFGSQLRSSVRKSVYICHFPTPGLRQKVSLRLDSHAGITLWDAEWTRYFPAKTKFLIKGDNHVFTKKNIRTKIRSLNGVSEIYVDGKLLCKIEPDQVISLPMDSYCQIKTMGIGDSVLRIELDRMPRLIPGLISNRVTASTQYLNTYRQIWANSRFTQSHIQSMLQTESVVVYPPVKILDMSKMNSTRDPYHIVSVGRFMSPSQGHCKNQHLLIKAFAKLSKDSHNPWSLSLVGGLDKRGQKYFDKLESQASKLDLKVNLLPNLSQEGKEKLIAEATYYWHAGGMNVSKGNPENMEHFGISVVEAIAAGLVPFVYDIAGPSEILDNYPQLRFKSLNELVSLTDASTKIDKGAIVEKLISIPKKYDQNAFQTRIKELIDSLI
jgi:glycosyltransferase involved in cell wall biosynthesis